MARHCFLEKNKTKYLKKWWIIYFDRIRINLIPILKCFFTKRFLVKTRLTFNPKKTINLPFFSIFQATKFYNKSLRFSTIRRETRKWLKKKRVPYDLLTIENNAIDVRSSKLSVLKKPKKIYRNRYYYAQKECFRYFVEDDITNAIKLSSFCEFVFLINHKYNINYPNDLPKNILRVDDWSQIKTIIRELG